MNKQALLYAAKLAYPDKSDLIQEYQNYFQINDDSDWVALRETLEIKQGITLLYIYKRGVWEPLCPDTYDAKLNMQNDKVDNAQLEHENPRELALMICEVLSELS